MLCRVLVGSVQGLALKRTQASGLSRVGTIVGETHCRGNAPETPRMDHAFLALTATGFALLIVSCAAALALH